MPAKPDPALEAQIILIHGNDEFRVDQRARELLAARCPGSEADGSLTTLRGDVEAVDDAVAVLKQALTAVQSLNMFNPQNVTWLREVMFLSGSAFQNGEVKDLVEKFQTLLAEGLGPEQVLVITAAGKLNANSRFFKALKKCAHIETFERTTKEWEIADEAKQQLQAAFQAREITIRPDALDELAARVGNDTRLMRNEVEKLDLCAADRTVTLELIEWMVPMQQEAQVWKLADCIGQRDLEAAMGFLQRMETQGANPVAAMAVLHNSLREMAYLGACLHQGAARLEDRGRFGSYTFTDPDAQEGFELLTGDKKRSPHRMFLLGRQARGFSVKQLDRILRLSAETYDGFFFRPFSHYEQLRLLLLRIFYECMGKAA